MVRSQRSIIIDSIRKAGFQNVEVLSEQLYTGSDYDNQLDGKRKKKITSVVIKAVK